MDVAKKTYSVVLQLVFCVIVATAASCAKPLLYGKVQQVSVVRAGFSGPYSDVYEATKWALNQAGYSIQEESKQRGTIVTDWRPSTPDSHYVEVFNRRDYGTTAAYYHLDLALYQEAGKTQIAVRSISKSVVSHLKSTEIEEKRILSLVEQSLREKDIEVTNLGVTHS